MKNTIISMGAGALALLASPAAATTQVVTFLTPGLHEWVVPYTMTYSIYGAGAQGGSGYDPASDLRTIGGLGAVVGGRFTLQAGDVLHAYVAGRGRDGQYQLGSNSGGGGGGGATTLRATLAAGNIDALLMVAGGGGGGGTRIDVQADGGQIGPNGTTTGSAQAGMNGLGGGGGIGVFSQPVFVGGGGGGTGTLGFGGDGTGVYAGGGGYASVGGKGSNFFGGDGGYGGGGGGDGFAGAGGGGGGFSGGAGGDTIVGTVNRTARGLSGGGGGSYMNTTDRLLSFANFKVGHGALSISYDLADPDNPPVDNPPIDNPPIENPPVDAVPEPATWAMMIVGFGLVGGSIRQRKPRRVLF